MNKKIILDILKSAVIVLLILGAVFALRAPAADLNALPTDIRAQYVDSSGLPYFSEMDSYYNLRLTENYVDHGYPGDTFINGTEMDMHRVAPDGVELTYELGITYITSWLHDFVNMFGSFSVKEVAFWTGAFISCLAVIPAYIFARRVTNDYGAIVASLLICLAPNYFAHTFPGFFDTDMFYFIFPLFFILFFMESMRSKNLIHKIVFAILSVISIGIFSISWTGYIFYIAVMGAFVVVYAILLLFLNRNSQSKTIVERLKGILHQKEFLSIGLVLVFGVISLSAFQGIDAIFNIFQRLFGLLSLQDVAGSATAFPNVLVSVAEMQIPVLVSGGMGGAFLTNTNGVINGIGGISILFAALIVLYVFATKVWKLGKNKIEYDSSKKPPKSERQSSAKKLDDDKKFKLPFGDDIFLKGHDSDEAKRLSLMYGTLFFVWTLVCIVAVTQGSRFITTLVLPFSLLAGIFVGYCTDYIKYKQNNNNWLMVISVLTGFLAGYPLMQINRTLGIILIIAIIGIVGLLIYGVKDKEFSFNNVPLKKYVIVIAVCLALVSPTICGAYQTAYSVVPGTSDAMWNSMEWIDENQANDTVITSWWDFGYLFEIAADRQTTFDGGSQSGERAFWLGQAMTTDNLELSAGIFRMMNTEGGRAVEALNNYTDGDTGLTTSILIEVLPLTKEDAINTMVNKYSLTKTEASDVAQYSHPDNPRPTTFVASSDMLQKAGWWSYFGNWDFEKQESEHYQYYIATQEFKVAPGSSDKLPILEDSGVTFNVVVNRGADNNTTAYTEAVYAHNGSQIYINDTPYNPLNISNIIVIQDGYLVKNETINNSNNANYSLMLMINEDYVSPILMSNELQNSMFTQLYLLGGSNQTVFKNVHMDTGVSLWEVQFNNTVAGGGSSSTTTNATT
ncbi:STT3 domain-containing protein [Methanobrevibacter sp. DSM 116169]|uniref:STT3 domain-containing protein n=1 Tax=Methanobrevibacter sp. DSM 116169 TaxID=3242727 RepID=UPI0038FD18A2